MSRLDRYVVRQVMELTAIVALGLVSIYTLVVFVSDINESGKGSYGMVQVMEYSLLMIPSSLYTLMPIIALLGTLRGVGALARSGELTAMRAAGISLSRVGSAVVAGGVSLAALAFVLGDSIAPACENFANAMKDTAKGGGGAMVKPIWLRDADSVVRIDHLEAEDRVRDMAVYQLGDDGRLRAALSAEEGRYVDGHWQLSGVRRTDFSAERTTVITTPQFELDTGIKPNLLRLFILEAGSLSVHGLGRLIGYMNENGLDPSKYRLLLWRRLVEPLTVLVMMLFAVPFVTGQFRDANAGQRLLLGALVGIVFYVLNKVSVSLGDIYQWPAPLAAGTPTLILAMLAAYRMRRAR